MIVSSSLLALFLMSAPPAAPAAAPKTEVKLCAHAVEKSGVWTCAYPLKAEVARKRHWSYRFTLEGGRTVKVEVVNGAGKLLDGTIPTSVSPLLSGSVEYVWSADGKGFWATIRGREGNVEERWKAASRVRDKYRRPAPGETDPEKARVKGSGPCREKWTEDNLGFVKTVRFFNWKDQPRKTLDGAYGYQYERDAQGVIVTEVPLNLEGKPGQAGLRQVKFTYKYDSAGNLLSASSVDKEDKPAYLKTFHYSKITYDSVGNPVSEAFLDKEGKPEKNYDDIWMWKARYDASGNLVERLYFDLAGKPKLSKEGIGGSSFSFDANGQRTGSCNLGVDGKPVANARGEVCRKWTLDGQGRVVETQFYNAQGKPAARKDGVARIRLKKSEDGTVYEEWNFDLADQPTLDEDKIHGSISTTDDVRHTLLMCNYGIDKKKKNDKDGVACTLMTFNEDESSIEEWTTDEKGALALNADGVAGCKTKYDEFAREVEHWFYGTKRELVMHKELQHAGMVTKYDADGEFEDMIAYDADREPIVEKGVPDENDPGNLEDDDPSTPEKEWD